MGHKSDKKKKKVAVYFCTTITPVRLAVAGCSTGSWVELLITFSLVARSVPFSTVNASE